VSGRPVLVAVDSNDVYWTTGGGGDAADVSQAIVQANLDGTGVTTLIPTSGASGVAVAGGLSTGPSPRAPEYP
jgi:hypothetical protein